MRHTLCINMIRRKQDIQRSLRQLPRNPVGIAFLSLLGISLWIIISQSQWGLRGRYFPNMQWTGKPVISRIDATPGLSKPLRDRRIPSPETYSVKWSGWLVIQHPGTYRFVAASDDGSHLFIDRQLLIDNGGAHGFKRRDAEIALSPGTHHIEIHYVQMGGDSIMRALWAPPGQPEHVIPSAVFFARKPTLFGLWLRQLTVFLKTVLLVLWAGFLLALLGVALKKYRARRPIRTLWTREQQIVAGLVGVCLAGLALCVYASWHRPVGQTPLPNWQITSSHHPEQAALAIDRWQDTAWTTGEPMRPGMFLEVDLKAATRIEKLVISHAFFPNHYPRGYRIELSSDKQRWITSPFVDSAFTPDATTIYLPPQTARYLRIVQTWYAHNTAWNVSELDLYHPAWLPRPYQQPLLLCLACGLLTLIVFFLMSLVAEFQTCPPGIRIGVILLIAGGFLLRIFLVHAHVLDVDEVDYLSFIRWVPESDWQWLKTLFTTGDVTRTPLLHLLFARWFLKITHHPALAMRLTSVILGTFTIPLSLLLWRRAAARHAAWTEAFLAAALTAAFAYHVCWSRNGHGENNATFFYIVFLWVASDSFSPSPPYKRLFLFSGLALFAGFYFHGIITIAPGGLFLFAALDWLLSKCKLSRWQPLRWKPYLPLFLSSAIFIGYCYYVLFLKESGGFAESTTFAGYETAETFPRMLHFLQARWRCLATNLSDFWLDEYGFPGYLNYFLIGLICLGFGDVIRQRQKTAWFVNFQALCFVVLISAVETTGTFERHYPVIIIPFTGLIARGIIVIARLFKTPRWRAIVQWSMGLVSLAAFLFITINGIFIAPPTPPSISACFYGGRDTSLANLLRYIRQSPRGANSLVMTTSSGLQDYAEVYRIRITASENRAIMTAIEQRAISELPIFILVDAGRMPESKVMRAIVQCYDHVSTEREVGFALYELRETCAEGL